MTQCTHVTQGASRQAPSENMPVQTDITVMALLGGVVDGNNSRKVLAHRGPSYSGVSVEDIAVKGLLLTLLKFPDFTCNKQGQQHRTLVSLVCCC